MTLLNLKNVRKYVKNRDFLICFYRSKCCKVCFVYTFIHLYAFLCILSIAERLYFDESLIRYDDRNLISNFCCVPPRSETEHIIRHACIVSLWETIHACPIICSVSELVLARFAVLTCYRSLYRNLRWAH